MNAPFMAFDISAKRGVLVLAVLLIVVLTGLAYAPVLHNGFINYDDDGFVTGNTLVRQGLTFHGLTWAFTTTLTGNWQPLTWLSHMLDVELFGLNPAGHHGTSLLIHLANTLILFFLLAKLTGFIGRSLFVALLFSLHPLHVESVAWIAERKDVLSTLFLLLTITAYLEYRRQPGLARYLSVVMIFACGLMSKPMLVTVPFLLLLVDYWLGRLSSHASDRQDREPRVLLLEKLPLLAMAMAFSALTVFSQDSAGALHDVSRVSWLDNLGNALLSYLKYLEKMFWPVDLAVIYPFDANAITALKVATAVGALALITLAVVKQWQKRPYLAFGWCWYLVTLLPVSGVVRIGAQAFADRYTYIPLIGIFIMLAWGAAEFAEKAVSGRIAATAAAAMIVMSLSMMTRSQIRHWADDHTLFSHALAVTANNWIAHACLGMDLTRQNRLDDAIRHFQEAVRINPEYSFANQNLGKFYFLMGKTNEAIAHLRTAIRTDHKSTEAHLYLGYAYLETGAIDLAKEVFLQLSELDENVAESLAFAIRQKGVAVGH